MTAALTLLAIDLGTQSLRVTALDVGGTRLWTWSRPVASHVDGLVSEQDPAQWTSLLMEGLDAASRAGLRPDAIAACGPLAGYVAIDANGTALTPAVMYADSRPAPQAASVETVLATSARWPRVAAADPFPQWLRLRQDAPEIAARTRYFLDATGWLAFILTGIATLNPFTAIRLYTPEVAARFGIDTAVFGSPVAIGVRIGPLVPALAARWGWADTPVIGATFDSKCAYIASGISAPGSALDISGTVTSFGVMSARAVDDPGRRVYSLPFNHGHLVRGSTAAAGSILEWARGLLSADFEALDAMAAGSPPGAGGLLLLPYHAGARAPLWQPQRRGALEGLSLASGRAEIARAVYDSLGLSLRHIVEVIEDCGVPVEHIRLSGGLSRNPVLAQIKADILGKPLVALAESELTTQGLAIIAAVALGAYADHRLAARALVRDGRRFMPSAERGPFDALFARYRARAEGAAGGEASGRWPEPVVRPA